MWLGIIFGLIVGLSLGSFAAAVASGDGGWCDGSGAVSGPVRYPAVVRRIVLPGFFLLAAGNVQAIGDMSGLVVFVFWIFGIAAVLWLAFCIFLIYLLRHQRPLQRFGISGLVFLSPLLVLVAELAGARLSEKLRPPLQETAQTATSLLGVSLPSGSELIYEADGAWGRTLLAATPPVPVAVGNLMVRSLRQSSDDALEVMLVGDQSIDGWSCLARLPVTVRRQGDDWRLSACAISTTPIGDFVWPDGTLLQRPPRGDHLSWFDDSYLCGGECPSVFWRGLQLTSAHGEYDAQRRTLDWAGTTFDGESRLGPYRFAAWAKLQLTASGDVEIRGDGRDSRQGTALSCLRLGVEGGEPRPCPATS